MDRIRAFGVVLGCVLLLCASQSGAQITVYQTDMPHSIGDTSIYKFSESDLEVLVGDTGGPQAWAFDTTFTGHTVSVAVVDKDATPFAPQFPDANLVWYYGLEDTGQVYVYFHLGSDLFVEHGFGFDTPETTFAQVWEVPDTLMVFPATYGTAWSSHSLATDTLNPQTWLTTERFTHNLADAFGTVTLPMGTYSALRVATLDTTIITTYYLGIPVLADTTIGMEYSWVTRHLGLLSSVSQMPGFARDTIVEGELQVLVASNIGISESGQSVPLLSPLEARPNPFSGQVEFRLSLADEGPVQVTLYDPSGRRVRSLFDGRATVLALTWNGTDNRGRTLPPGVYFCRALTPEGAFLARVVLKK